MNYFYSQFPSTANLKAIENIIIAMTPSRMRQEFGFCIIGAKSFAPYERPKKNTKLARDAPIANPTFNSPENCCAIEPIRITVSR